MTELVRGIGFRLTELRADIRRLALADRLVTGSATYARREIVLVRVDLETGGRTVRGFGEASPLPGWSHETPEAVRSALEQRISSDTPFESISEIDHALPWLTDMPVTRFGLETAILDALARSLDRPLCALLARDPDAATAESVPVQFTLGILDTAASIARLESAMESGYTHAKLKVGQGDPAADVARILRVAERLPGLTIRIDANGAWTVEAALQALHALPPELVELVEQPVRDTVLSELLSRFDGRGPRVAADESCGKAERARALIRSGRLGAVVVKPAAIGGLLPTAELVRLAIRHGVQVIFSNLMESAVGRFATAHLAAAHPELPGPHGLATGAWLAEDVGPCPDRLDRGRLFLHQGAGLGFVPGNPR
ncbi:MAG: o-succinylbenzoate synthase [Candidatus Wenzhouxiangella sp. M2_3B_020]